MGDGFSWNLVVVYASKSYHARREIWSAVGAIISDEVPMLIGGDFNCILRQGEKKGGRVFRYAAASREFEQFMISNGLVDAGFEGVPFTWCNNEYVASRIWVRHDRILLNACAVNLLPGFRVRHLLRVGSDHCPLLFTADQLSFSNRHGGVRFEESWLDCPEAEHIVRRAWGTPMGGSTASRLARKCFRALGMLKEWNGNTISSLSECQKELVDRIGVLQRLDAGELGVNEEELAELRMLVRRLHRVQGIISAWWQQRAKVRWLEEGDHNSSFFHSVATSRRKANRILCLVDELGNSISSQQGIMQVLVNFFQQKWVSKGIQVADLPLFGEAQMLSDSKRDGLVAPVSSSEIRQVIFSLGRGRSPGVDGVTGSFFRGFWNTVGSEVVEAVQ